eukprot:10832918-Karenia_brevis.AAC.1
MAQPITNTGAPGSMQVDQGRDSNAAGSGPSGADRAMQRVGPPPRATAGMEYNQKELDQVVQHFLGTLPQGTPQGLGSPL